MLKHLFRKIHARYTASANGALLEDFAGWLMSVGYARRATRGHVRRLNQVLDRLTSETLVREARISASHFVASICLGVGAATVSGHPAHL